MAYKVTSDLFKLIEGVLKDAFMKDQCSEFGNLDGMNGTCVDCSKDNDVLFKACWAKRFKGQDLRD